MKKIIRAGKHSLAVIIPADFAHSLGINPGDNVKVITSLDKGLMSVFFSGAVQLKLPTSSAK